MFLGESQHSLDAKGRVILPVRFRGQLESGVFIAKGLDGCLWIMPPAAWNDLTQRLSQAPISDPRARKLTRFLFGGASEDRPDRQGRVSIPEPLRRHAGLELEQEVVVIGARERIEIWSPERYEAYRDASEPTIEEDIAGLAT